MTQSSLLKYFQELANKKIIGDDPDAKKRRFGRYTPSTLANLGKLSLDLKNFVLLVGYFEANIVTQVKSTKLMSFSIMILKSCPTMDNVAEDKIIDDATAIAEQIWAKMRWDTRKGNGWTMADFSQFDDASYRIEPVKGLLDNTCGVEVLLSFKQGLDYCGEYKAELWADVPKELPNV